MALRDGRFFTSATVDCGCQGCQVTSPTPLARDERVFVELRGEGSEETYWFAGRIAWAADRPPFRAGVLYDDRYCADARGLFSRLAGAHPEATAAVPSELPMEAIVAPAAAHAGEPLPPAEAEVLRAVGDGARLCDLRDRLASRWEPGVSALFSLLARGVLEVKASDPTEPAP